MTDQTRSNTGNAGEILQRAHAALDGLEDQMKDLREEQKEIMKGLKAQGFDLKVFREIRKLRKMKPVDRSEFEELRSLYLQALGLF